MRKLRHREVRLLAQDLKCSKKQSDFRVCTLNPHFSLPSKQKHDKAMIIEVKEGARSQVYAAQRG
jgi:hypothetical protein